MNAPIITTLDLETRPTEAYVWGLFDQRVALNQIIRPGGIILVAAQEVGKKVHSRAEWDGGGWEAMMRWAWDVCDRTDYLVGYNSIGFDVKHLQAAWAELGMTPPSPWRNIDLLRTVRANFQWPSKKLEFVCRQLGVSHKTDPGGFSTWADILNGDDKARVAAQKRMRKYAENDVKITTELFERLRPWITGINIPLVDGTGEERPACTNCGGENIIRKGTAFTNTTSYKRYVCTDCGKWLRARKSESLKTVLVGA
jgi:hypothetical protein